jgi:hypothetical protein
MIKRVNEFLNEDVESQENMFQGDDDKYLELSEILTQLLDYHSDKYTDSYNAEGKINFLKYKKFNRKYFRVAELNEISKKFF